MARRENLGKVSALIVSLGLFLTSFGAIAADSSPTTIQKGVWELFISVKDQSKAARQCIPSDISVDDFMGNLTSWKSCKYTSKITDSAHPDHITTQFDLQCTEAPVIQGFGAFVLSRTLAEFSTNIRVLATAPDGNKVEIPVTVTGVRKGNCP